jgi:beta-lactamase regulating signal transducer with metallopeptidase domain
MGIGVSLILIAAGAILTWAVNATVSGLNIHTIGIILMVVGAVGLVLSMMFWSSWGGVGGARRRTTYVDEGPPAGY